MNENNQEVNEEVIEKINEILLTQEDIIPDTNQLMVIPGGETTNQEYSPVSTESAQDLLERLRKVQVLQEFAKKEAARRRTLRKPKNFLAKKLKKRKISKASQKRNRK